MARFASGKRAYGISDRSGFRYRKADMRKEWNGLLVGPDEYEPKHPQLTPPRNISDPQAIKDARTDRTEPAVEVLLDLDPFTSGSASSSIITVKEKSHGRSSSDVVRFRTTQSFDGFTSTALENNNGFTITVVDSDSYTFNMNERGSSETATTGSVVGGGKVVSAGPVTVSA